MNSEKSPMMFNVKWDHYGTFRRFQIVNESDVDLYAALLDKINSVVPNFTDNLAWTDEEGDLILFTTGVEIKDYLACTDSKILRIKTIESNDRRSHKSTEMKSNGCKFERESHTNVSCDRCDQPVFGIRYKCATCRDFDLCEDCEKEGVHADHPMIRYANQRTPKLEQGRSGRYKFGQVPNGYSDPFMQSGLFGSVAQAAQEAATTAAERAAEHAAAAAAAFTANMSETRSQANDRSQHLRESMVHGMDYLKEVGTQIQQALGNFGIDVDVDVEHNGAKENLKNGKKKANANVSQFNDNKPQQNERSGDDTTTDSGKVSETVSDTTNEQSPKVESFKRVVSSGNESGLLENLHIPLKKMHISNEEKTVNVAATDVEIDQGTVISDDVSDGWTIMGENSTAVEQEEPINQLYPTLVKSDKKCKAGVPFIVPLSGPHNPHCHFIFPDQDIALCVEQLENMGFDNCNGWVTKLAIDFNGDVSAVIEAVKKDTVYAQHLKDTKNYDD